MNVARAAFILLTTLLGISIAFGRDPNQAWIGALSGLAFGQTVLAKACAEAGISFDNNEAHSAAYDAERTAELFCEIVNRWKECGGWMPSFE